MSLGEYIVLVVLLKVLSALLCWQCCPMKVLYYKSNNALNMSVKPVNINVESKNNKNLNNQIYKGVATINFKSDEKENVDLHNRKNVKVNKFNLRLNNLKNKFIRMLYAFLFKSTADTQVENFHRSLKYFVLCGQCLGLFPMVNILTQERSRSRFKIFSWRYLLCIIVCLGEMVAAILSFGRLICDPVTVNSIAFFAFYFSTCLTSILFIRVANKWHHLIKEVASSDLNEYIDPYVQYKCNFAILIVISLSLLEHIFSVTSKYSQVQNCYSKDIYEMYMRTSFPWLFEANVSYSLPLGIYLEIQNLSSTINWTYSHLFVVCMSLYLSSILEQLNKKILSREGQYLPASYWRAIREDYNRATRLVRSFDDVINSIVFVSFACNLFFVCLQLYYFLAHGVRVRQGVFGDTCPYNPSGIFNGYEYAIYYTFSLFFVLLRSLTVSLIAARVHSASMVVAPSLYNVPSPAYCTEVQRFIEQVHGDTVALTGLNFFYVTKELVLSVVGTIATYELVLLQFNGEDSTKSK